MKKSILIVIAAVVVILVISLGYLGYSGYLNPSTGPTPTPPPEAPVQETARDSAISYIATNHSEIASLTTNLTWTGGRQETGLVGSETYIYLAGNWNVTITNAVIPDPTYTVSAVYTDTASQVTIEWQGTYANAAITETSYNYVVP